MDKISVARFTEKIIEKTGCENADAIMIITVNGSDVNTSVAGTRPAFADSNTIALVSAMHAILEQKFKIADLIYESLMRRGEIHSEFHERDIQISNGELAADKLEERSEAKACPERDWADDFLDGLINLLEHTFGGDDDAHDD